MTDQGWAKSTGAVTIFVEDMAAMVEFYERVFGLPQLFSDESSAVYKFGDIMINILRIEDAPELIEPAKVAGAAGARSMFTIHVDDVDALYANLVAKGVEFLNGPLDRPWGPRTAAFADSAGHWWEIAS